MTAKTDYDDLAQLRGALTAEDPDRRATAYSAVLEQDLDVSTILKGDVPETAVQGLRDGGVIPEADESETGPPAASVRQETLEVLKEIRDAVQNDGGSA